MQAIRHCSRFPFTWKNSYNLWIERNHLLYMTYFKITRKIQLICWLFILGSMTLPLQKLPISLKLPSISWAKLSNWTYRLYMFLELDSLRPLKQLIGCPTLKKSMILSLNCMSSREWGLNRGREGKLWRKLRMRWSKKLGIQAKRKTKKLEVLRSME